MVATGSCETDFGAFATRAFFNVCLLDLSADSVEDEEDCRCLLQGQLPTILGQYITVLLHQSLLRRQDLLLLFFFVRKEEDGKHRVVDGLE